VVGEWKGNGSTLRLHGRFVFLGCCLTSNNMQTRCVHSLSPFAFSVQNPKGPYQTMEDLWDEPEAE
jgi:hypothetical protein